MPRVHKAVTADLAATLEGSPMKFRLFTLVLLLSVRGAAAQERIPDDHAKMIAKALVEASGKIKGPISVEVDTDRPYAKRKDEHGAMVVPATKLTAELIDKAGADIVPIGLLFIRQLSLMADDRLLPVEKMHEVSFKHNENDVTVHLCYLGVLKAKDKTNLVILGKDKKPLVSMPLTKIDEKQELPMEFLVSIEPDDTATLSLTILGKHKAKLLVGVPK
jgi:hypothetical protein